MNRLILTLTVLVICAAPLAGLADWDPEYPYTKWVQMPDLNGWDIKVTAPKVLADDFPCWDPDPITDIHFWGSWRHDDVGQIVQIKWSIHKNIPAGVDPDQPWSHPGDWIWGGVVSPGQFTVRHWGDGDQGWYDPNTGEVYEHDHSGIWQVNMFLDEADWFWQEGSPDGVNPTIYWLDLQVIVADPVNTAFGWKTSDIQWEDDAVWQDEDWGGFWEPLEDPIRPVSLDLAFVITTIPEPGILAIAGLGLLALLRRKK